MDDGQTYERFANNFGLVEVNWKEEFYKLPECNDNEVVYLLRRGIIYNDVKQLIRSSNNSISILVYEDDFEEGIVKRNITNDGQRFSCHTGTN